MVESPFWREKEKDGEETVRMGRSIKCKLRNPWLSRSDLAYVHQQSLLTLF